MIDHANLEEFADAENYDLEDPSATGVAFYTALAQQTGGPILELACGTGRVAIPIAGLGLPVTGVDIVPAMIDQARRKSAGLPAHWLVGDARTLNLQTHFRLVFLTGNAFQLFLTRTDQEALLACVRAQLDDDGLFAFETRNPHLPGSAALDGVEGLFTTLETRAEEQPFGAYTDRHGRTVHISHTQRYDPTAQILEWTTYRRWHDAAGPHTNTTRIAVRFTFPDELAQLLHANGLTLLRQYGDWDLSPLTPRSPSIICVCRKRKDA